MNSLVDKIGGRKAAACMTGLVVLVGCFLYKGVLPSELVNAVQYLVTTYLAGNIAADVVDGVNTTVQKKAEIQAQAVVVEPVKYDDSAIMARLTQVGQALGAQATTLQQVVNHLSGPPAPQQNIR